MTQQDVENWSGHVLDHKSIGSIRGNFFVPAYQRGYRWTREDVKRLLDDVWENKQINGDYSLQPVVVKFINNGSNETDNSSQPEWELIDGQQRLTTLYLIFQFMKDKKWRVNAAPYSIRYETRPNSTSYLQSLNPALAMSNIDFYHLRQAYEQIEEWFTKDLDSFAQEDKANDFFGHLTKKVKIIWYQVASAPHLSQQEITSDSIALFTRLNVGRIPLTDAELIKAALLSSIPMELADRSREIAAQWDGIERDLHQANIWAFVSGLDASCGDEKYPTRISLLLDTLADEKMPTKGRRPRYHTFDTLRAEISQDFSAFWQKVVALHAHILGWYEQPKIYNKIGFLVACRVPFGDIVRLATLPAEKKPKKSEFEALLDNRIRERIKVNDASIEDLSYEDKSSGYPKLLELLLLMNVETSTLTHQHFPFSRHVGQAWSLEHIHAQNAAILNKAEQWKTWLQHQMPALDAVSTEEHSKKIDLIKSDMAAAITAINSEKPGAFSGEKFNELSARVLELLNKDDEPDHSIRNMALLSSKDNSSLNNSVFEVKRQMILELDRAGEYVPICTRNVFLKYYAAADAQQPHFWSDKDKTSYLSAVRDTLKSYLT